MDRGPSEPDVRSKPLSGRPSSHTRAQLPKTSPRNNGSKALSPRVLASLQNSDQPNLGRSPSPQQVYGRVTPLSLERGSPNQLDRGSPRELGSNKPKLPPVSPSVKKKTGKQVSPRQKNESRALVPQSAGAMASLKAAQEALPIVKKDGMYFPKGKKKKSLLKKKKIIIMKTNKASACGHCVFQNPTSSPLQERSRKIEIVS